MMDLRIYPDQALSVENDPITDFSDQLLQLALEMKTKCQDLKGYALAAPQVGIQKQLFVVIDHPELDACLPYTRAVDLSQVATTETVKSVPWFCANPEIIESSGEFRYKESCLSMPGVTASLARPAMIRFRYQDHLGQHHTFLCGGLLARVIQHEMDHLAGKLFVERLDPFTKNKTMGAINKLRRKKSTSG